MKYNPIKFAKKEIKVFLGKCSLEEVDHPITRDVIGGGLLIFSAVFFAMGMILIIGAGLPHCSEKAIGSLYVSFFLSIPSICFYLLWVANQWIETKIKEYCKKKENPPE